MGLEEVVAEGIRFGVQHNVDITLAQQLHFFAAVLAGFGKAQALQPVAQARADGFVDRELQELHAVISAGRRRGEQHARFDRRVLLLQAQAGLFFEVQQRTQAVGGILPGRCGAEAVVEDFQRQRATVTRGEDRRQETGHVHFALPREAAKVAAPLQHIHGQDRRIGHLHEEDLVAGDVADRAGVTFERQGVEAVEDHPECRVVGLAHQVPHLLVSVDVAAPGQRFVTNAQATLAGMFAQQAQVVDQQLLVTQGIGLDVAAHQHQVGTQLLHQVELAFGAVEVFLQAVTAAAFKVAERLEQGDGNAQVGAHLAHLARAASVIEQIVLEDLDAVKTGGGDGFELFRQSAAQGHGSDRTLHGGSSLLLEEYGAIRANNPCHSLWHDRLFAGKVVASISLYGMVSFAFDYRTKPVLANC